MDETRVIYHIDDEETPYLVKIPISPQKVTLGDFKNVLNRPNYKYFFKSMDDDFGVVKEEIVEDGAHLPCFNGRVVSWLVSADGSNQSDGGSQCTTDSVHPSIGVNVNNSSNQTDSIFSTTDTESIINSRRRHHHHYHHHHHQTPLPPPLKYNLGPLYNGDGASSVISSDLETTSFQSETTDRHTALSECSSISRLHVTGGGGRNKQRSQRRRKQRLPPMSRTSSYSSITDSTMSLNIITVSLNMDTVNFLGISIVGQSNKGGDGGIYVGSIMKGGAVALDGRIEPGDMILQVNDVNFENMSNDEAVRVLREVVQKPGPIKLVVAKCWDPNPKGYFTIPRTEPVRPIDPGAWVAHTAAVRGDPIPSPPSSSTVSSSSITSTIPANDRDCNLTVDLEEPLTINSPMYTVVQAMQQSDSGLEIRERMWLKITIPNAFIGTDMIDWLVAHVQGFQDRRDAKKYASHLLQAGFIRHTVNKVTFSERCYYVFGDICAAMSHLRVSQQRDETNSEMTTTNPLPNVVPPYMPYSGTYNPMEYMPMPFYTTSENTIYGYNREESILGGGSGGSSNSSDRLKDMTGRNSTSDSDLTSLAGPVRCNLPIATTLTTTTTTLTTTTTASGGNENGSSNSSERSSGTQVPMGGGGGAPPKDIAGSRQSFKIAMGNPCEMFVDVM